MRVCTYILLQVFIDSYVCVAAHGSHERCTIRIVIGCEGLVAKGSGGTLAGGSWLIELSSQPVCSRELPGLQVRRATSGLRAVRPSEGTASCGLRSGRAGARNASRSGQWARLAGTAAASCAALHQGVEARAGENAEEQEELSGVESDGATDQFCRLGIDAAGGTGRAPGTFFGGGLFAAGYGFSSCWSLVPTAFGWQRVWVCGPYGYGYGGYYYLSPESDPATYSAANSHQT